ncbi:QacE family quaternary ammonium compound efflux SMR transporter [Aquibacillus halophilus]|uniref:QacE family quaternary ammonium compound efflux SMR transporter n=1 Tax=Aquibacillus halophilus TaxID=930132 RepID=A0A6A8DL79_9BACI|nr:SMR family transporter [Aquibacillus halophilus]MRH44509.1 QacE family quaternary ammonium compound efflux SMR transporter [Aquibacillus halophilus]
MAWLAIIIAGILEVLGVLNIKRLAMGKRDALLYLIITFGSSLSLLSYAMQTLPMGTVYGIWTGIGTVGSTIMGMVLYGEPKEWKRILFISIILSSAVGLKLIS